MRVAVLFTVLAACGRVGLELPDAAEFTEARDDQGRFVVAVTRDGRVRHAGKDVTLDELAAILEKADYPDIVFRVDADALWCHVQWAQWIADEYTIDSIGFVIKKGGGERTLMVASVHAFAMQPLAFDFGSRVSVRTREDGAYSVGKRKTKSLRQVRQWIKDVGELGWPAVYAIEPRLKTPAIEVLEVLNAFHEIGEERVLLALAAPHPWVREQKRLPDPREDFWLVRWFITDLTQIDTAPLILPVAHMGNPDQDNDPDDRLIINLDEKGRILWQEEPKSLSELRKILSDAKRIYNLRRKAKGSSGTMQVAPDGREATRLFVLLRADKDTPWLHVKWILSLLHEESFFRLQFAVSRSADLSWTEEEARLVGTTRRDAIPWVFKTLDCKLQAFLPIAPSGANDVFVDVDPRAALDWIRKSIRTRYEELKELDGDKKIKGRIDAPDTMPLKRVIAVLNAFHDARLKRVDFAGVKPAPRKVWGLKALPR